MKAHVVFQLKLSQRQLHASLSSYFSTIHPWLYIVQAYKGVFRGPLEVKNVLFNVK